jgi:hypothetical protein
MRGGLLNKAKRGDLKRAIPIGYVYDDNGRIIMDPDAQVREAITMFFNTFTRVGSAGGIVREYVNQEILFPHRQHKGFRLGELSWKKMTLSTAVQTLKNPMYAGVYTFGKTQAKNTVHGCKHVVVPREQYHAWLPNSHPQYISEAQFDENNRQLVENSHPRPGGGHGGAVREGSALLQGIALCGKCGRRMTTRYSNSNMANQPMYVCDHNRRHHGEAPCQFVSGGNIDITIESMLLETINPLTIDAAIAIQREMSERKEEIFRMYSQQMERARYDMDLVKRRYLLVDPDNRLVAADLERDWNQKVISYETAKTAYEQKCGMEICAVDDEMNLSLNQLIADFPKIWNDPRTSSREKKRIARHILEDVTITAGVSEILLGVRFKGGATSIIEIPKLKRNLNLINAEKDAVSEIRALLPSGMTYSEIADILNEKGLKNGLQDKPFTWQSISNLVQRFDLPTHTDIILSNVDGWLTAKDKMAELGIDKSTLYRMRKSGKVIFKECSYHGLAYLYKPDAPNA